MTNPADKSLTDKSLDAAYNIFDYAQNILEPTIKLGVTGLSRSGKTVFITSLIYHLLHRGQLKFFEPETSGRIIKVYLEPHPDDLLPRFDYEGNLAQLTSNNPSWPEGTRHISQLRLTIIYQSDSFFSQYLGHSKLHIDIIDYPGEWLLDLPLLSKDYQTWSKEAFEFAKQSHATPFAAEWLQATKDTSPNQPMDEGEAKRLADKFTNFLKQTRDGAPDLATIPPGRFLMPGDLKGSPALTFAPLMTNPSGNSDNLPNPSDQTTLHALMERRYEAYKSLIIKPFYRKFFTRLDRQIVLVDVLSNLDAGPSHLTQLQNSLAEILKSFNPGASHWLTSIWNKKIDRLVFAATKADHLHHHNHDGLQDLLSHLTQQAIQQAEVKGAEVKVQAISALRTTHEVTIEQNNQTYLALKGTPVSGTNYQGQTFDGKKPIIFFPGDLPENTQTLFKNNQDLPPLDIVSFAPPAPEENKALMPHIRLDRALNMLIGDKLR